MIRRFSAGPLDGGTISRVREEGKSDCVGRRDVSILLSSCRYSLEVDKAPISVRPLASRIEVEGQERMTKSRAIEDCHLVIST